MHKINYVLVCFTLFLCRLEFKEKSTISFEELCQKFGVCSNVQFQKQPSFIHFNQPELVLV